MSLKQKLVFNERNRKVIVVNEEPKVLRLEKILRKFIKKYEKGIVIRKKNALSENIETNRNET